MSVDSRLTELAQLQPGWLDGEGAPPTPTALDEARRLLEGLADLGVAPARIYPTEQGGISAEWTRRRCEVSVSFEANGDAEVMLCSLSDGDSRFFHASASILDAAWLSNTMMKWVRGKEEL
jgi:hypothetical protein